MTTTPQTEATAATLAAWREAMGFTHRDAADALGCSRTSYAKWEGGEARVPKYIALACAAVALNIKVEGGADAEAEDEE